MKAGRAAEHGAERGAKTLGEVEPHAVVACRHLGRPERRRRPRRSSAAHRPYASSMPWAWAISATAASVARSARPCHRRGWPSARPTAASAAWRSESAVGSRWVTLSRCRTGRPRHAERRDLDAGQRARVRPPSAVRICAVSCASTASPGRQWVRMATSLHMVPLGRKIAASFPISAAMRPQRALMVGSSPLCSSPTSASIMAARMAGVGLVWVSE